MAPRRIRVGTTRPPVMVRTGTRDILPQRSTQGIPDMARMSTHLTEPGGIRPNPLIPLMRMKQRITAGMPNMPITNTWAMRATIITIIMPTWSRISASGFGFPWC